MNYSKILTFCSLVFVLGTAQPSRADQAGDVKAYLVEVLTKVDAAAADFVVNATAYAALVKSHGGVSGAVKADAAGMDALVEKMRENYKAMDSFGYETVEGIVAGVDAMAPYDIYLDAGVPESAGPDDVAPVVLTLGDGEKINKEGALFTYLIEPALWGGDKRWCVEVEGRSYPRPDVLVAAATDVRLKLAALFADAKAWNATEADCFGAMVVMTPTLSDYFEDWKESRFAGEKSGRFQAVSRVSDMRGIMSSCAVMFKAVEKSVAEKDAALAQSIGSGFDAILAFLDKIEASEKSGNITVAEIDELATQAKEKTDKLVPQIEQGAALTGHQISG